MAMTPIEFMRRIAELKREQLDKDQQLEALFPIEVLVPQPDGAAVVKRFGDFGAEDLQAVHWAITGYMYALNEDLLN
jgi:hypothetical protein